jgi:hypothetical protein
VKEARGWFHISSLCTTEVHEYIIGIVGREREKGRERGREGREGERHAWL